MRHTILLSVSFLSLLLLTAKAQVPATFNTAPEYPGGFPFAIADFNGDGNLDIVNAASVLLGNGDGTFKVGTFLPGSPSVSYIATADFNGDGKPDVAVLYQQPTAQPIQIFLGNGDGTFLSPINIAPSSSFSYFVVADVNNDGKPDLLTMDGGALEVFLGNGDGTFKRLAANFSQTVQLVGDFNGDGKVDILYAPGPNIEVWLGNGDGTFQATPVVSNLATGAAGAFAVVTADFNHDGKLDLGVMIGETACGSPDFPGAVWSFGVQLGNGDGSFQPVSPQASLTSGTSFCASPRTPGAAVGDINGDGIPDVVYAISGPIVGTLLGKGDGTFTSGNSYAVGNVGTANSIDGVALAAFVTGSSKLDIVEGDVRYYPLTPQISVLLGNGDDTFDAVPVLIPTPASGPIVSADFNGDGKPDVAMLSFESNGQPVIPILLDTPTGLVQTETPSTGLPADTGASLVAAADLRNNGKQDLLLEVTPASSSTEMLALLGNGDGTFSPSPVTSPMCGTASPEGPPTAQGLADFNGDHIPDLVSITTAALYVCLGKGDGTFGPAAEFLAGPGPVAAAFGDFNGDGKLDIAVLNSSSTSTVGLLLGNGDGTFQGVSFPISNNFYSVSTIVAADVNRDGKLDLIIGCNGYSSNDCIQVYLGNGDGTFNALPAQAGIAGTIIADFNGDGIPDVLAAGANLCLGRGDGTFSCQPFTYPPAYAYGASGPAVVADFNGDGKPDVAVPESYALVVLTNTTAANFTISASALSPTTVAPGNNATSTVAIQSSFGFSQTVALSCGTPPAGITCTFNPPTVASASGTSALTVSVGSTVQPGSYSLSVTGAAGSIANSTTVQVTVAGFTMSAGTLSPASLSAGGSATSTITLAAKGGFSDGVQLSCSSIILNGATATSKPPTCSFNPATLTSGSGSSTLTISTTGATAMLAPPAVRGTRLGCALWLPMWGIFVLGAGIGSRKRRPLALLLVLALGWLIMLVACGGSGNGGGGGGGGSGGTPAGTYTITVSASASGFPSQTTSLTLIVR
jgi:hypothetical protein